MLADPFIFCWNLNLLCLMSMLVQCYLGFGCEAIFPLCPLPHLFSHFWVQIKSLALSSWAPPQPASQCLLGARRVHGIALGTCVRGWWLGHPLPCILAPNGASGLCGLGHSSSRWTGLANRYQEYEVAWELEFWWGWRGMRFWWMEFKSVRDFVNSRSKWKKELPGSVLHTAALAEWHTHPLSIDTMSKYCHNKGHLWGGRCVEIIWGCPLIFYLKKVFSMLRRV